jgi:hypothetical protein
MSATIEQRPDTAHAPHRRRGLAGRWLRRLPLLIGLISLLGWFLPTLIAVTPLRNLMLSAAGSRLPEGIEVGSAKLSWTGPVELRDVRIPDEAGGSLLEVERIESETSLWDLATDGFTRALFHVFRPKLRLTMKENSTSIDSGVFRLLDQHAGSGKPIALDLENGLIVFVNEQGELLTEITDVTLTLEMTPVDGGSEGSLELRGRIVRDDGDGTLSVNAEWSGGKEGRTGHVVLDAARFPADALGPLLASRLDGRVLAGEVTGGVEADWQPVDGLLAGELQFNLDELIVELVADSTSSPGEDGGDVVPIEDAVQRWEFHESRLHAGGNYDPRVDLASLTDLTIDSDVVSLTAAGEVAGLRSAPRIDLRGELTSEPEVLIAFLDDALPEALQIEDLTIREFSAVGPVSELGSLFRAEPGRADGPLPASPEEELDLSANVSWSSLDLYGVPSTAGRVDARLADQRLQLVPLQVFVSTGRVETLPWLDLSASPRAFVLDEGPLVRDVAFTEEMCRTWLKYVSPLLADATGMEGRFSAQSGGGRMPLGDPRAADVSGMLEVHSGRVGPGPLAQQVIAIVEQVRTVAEGRVPPLFGGGGRRQRTWLELPEQNVKVRVSDGRVHHERMQYVAGDVTVATRGSVGFDESLDAVLEIPLQDNWLESNRYLASLKGQTVEVPLGGTLDQPQVDARVVNRLIEQMAAGAGAGLLQRLLDR